MTNPNTITTLMRPRCRIPTGTPDETGNNWQSLPATIVPQASLFGDYFTVGIVPPHTEIRAVADDDALYVRFDCALDDLKRLTPRTPGFPLAESERAWLHVHPRNDPVERLRFEADFRGLSAVNRQQRINGERSLGAVADNWSLSSTTSVEWKLFHGLAARGWWVEMEIPWRSLGLDKRPAVIGFECGRIFHAGLEGAPLDDVSWPDRKREANCEAVLEPGEALIGAEAIAPARLELDPPRFGRNTGRLILDGPGAKGSGRLVARTQSNDGRSVAEQSVAIRAGARSVEFAYWLDRALCSHLDVFGPQRLDLEWRDADDAILYAARLPLDRHLGICVDEPYDEPGGFEPLPGRNATARERALDRAARALPRLERRHTAQGAPSDFCLVHADGRLAVNLMADGAWEKLAAMVEERFATTEERLVGALLLAGQKSVTNLFLCHLFFDAKYEPTYRHGNMQDKMGPLSILRYGGGPAVARAAVLARLLQQVRDPSTGKPFVTRLLSLQKDGGPKLADRHGPYWQKAGPFGAVAVAYGGDHTLLDPTTLAVFVKADGRLATLDEMIGNETLRADGAGRLAAVYAGLSAEDVRREKPNRLWSKGVFPELAPNEDRPDTPFDPGYRQQPRVIIAPEAKESPPLEGFADTFGQPARRDGGLTVRWDKQSLRIEVAVRGVNLPALAGADRGFEEVHLALDSDHDHLRFHHFMVSAAGAARLWRDVVTNIQTLAKHLSTEQSSGTDEPATVTWSHTLTETPEGYRVLRLREIEGWVRCRSGKKVRVRLWTSLLDARRHPAKRLLRLYRERWEQELAIGELKQTLHGGALLRSQKVGTAWQEVAAVLVAQGLVARMRVGVAHRAHVPVLRVSFEKTLEAARVLCLVLAVAADLLSAAQLRELSQRLMERVAQQLSGPRRARSCPRAVRQPVCAWPRKQRASSCYGDFDYEVLKIKR
jgi:hypothetical protein